MSDIALDTNLLVIAHIAKLTDHAATRQKIEGHLADTKNRLILTPYVLQEFVHVITDTRRFERPPEMTEAVAVARNYLSKENVLLITSDLTAIDTAFSLLVEHRLGRNRIADTLLAATLRQHGIRQLWTKNVGDFKIFDFLQASDPTL